MSVLQEQTIQWRKEKGQQHNQWLTIMQALNRELKIEQHELH